MTTVIWETWLKPRSEEEGIRLTRKVWSDMRGFEGYVSHQIFIDQDAPGHIIVLGKWRSRADADGALEKYKGAETVRQLIPHLVRPRDRWVMYEDGEPSEIEQTSKGKKQ
jgi:quinol monooxygenase YgiN